MVSYDMNSEEDSKAEEERIKVEEEEDGSTVQDDNNLEEEATVVDVVDPCTICGMMPCDWVSFGDSICEECDELKEHMTQNNEIHFHAYKLYTWMKPSICIGMTEDLCRCVFVVKH